MSSHFFQDVNNQKYQLKHKIKQSEVAKQMQEKTI